MTGSGEVKAAFDRANSNFRRVGQYLTGSGESSGELLIRQVGALFDVAEPLLALWRTATGVDGAARGGATIAGKLSELRGLLLRADRTLPVNGEGNTMESHLMGTANTLDALMHLLSLSTGPSARSAAIIRKEAMTTHQTALHRYALSLRAPDTRVDAVRTNVNYEGRIGLVQRLHRGAVDMAGGVEAWSR